MSRITKLALVAALAVAAIWWLWPQRIARQTEPVRAKTLVAGPEHPRSTQRSEPEAARPMRSTARPGTERPHLRPTKVDIDRSPWMRTEEAEKPYLWRKGIADGFDAFCEQTGISDERAQELLQILYDYQDNALAYLRLQRELIHTGTYTADRFFVSPADNSQQMRERLDELLSEAEKEIWWRTMDHTGYTLHLAFQEIIKPVAP